CSPLGANSASPPPVTSRRTPCARARNCASTKLVVGVGEYENTGEIVTVKERIDEARVLVAGRSDDERVLRLSGRLQADTVRIGDALTADTRTGFAYEKIHRSEVEELMLEEIPDVGYTDIGGLR